MMVKGTRVVTGSVKSRVEEGRGGHIAWKVEWKRGESADDTTIVETEQVSWEQLLAMTFPGRKASPDGSHKAVGSFLWFSYQGLDIDTLVATQRELAAAPEFVALVYPPPAESGVERDNVLTAHVECELRCSITPPPRASNHDYARFERFGAKLKIRVL